MTANQIDNGNISVIRLILAGDGDTAVIVSMGSTLFLADTIQV